MLFKLHAAALLSLCALAAHAEDAALPVITTAELSGRLGSGAHDFTLVDARTRVEYGEGHVRGAVNCPSSETKDLLKKLVQNRSRQLVFYCNGPKCTKSQKAARAALALGYTNVVEYNEGLPAWGKAGLPIDGKPLPTFDAPAIAPDALAALVKKPHAPAVVDVRDAEEYEAFHVPGSINIPLDQLHKRHHEIPQDRNIVLACHAGHQSPIAARVLHALGRSDLKRLDGGVLAWRQKSLPTDSGSVARR
jgi:rhodanese-related sulfurtransferase